ncbi:hypothetical protein JOB18_005650 [Solea senegalensis]|uniref:Uncharacterized protein n=1 Tax=Solea senegalensis TaxID=28829 RepID=A0AAV6RHL7_SOLSE|nr:hypothetical protein JOB18_005650 [Solea senegalensis]
MCDRRKGRESLRFPVKEARSEHHHSWISPDSTCACYCEEAAARVHLLLLVRDAHDRDRGEVISRRETAWWLFLKTKHTHTHTRVYSSVLVYKPLNQSVFVAETRSRWFFLSNISPCEFDFSADERRHCMKRPHL